VTSLTGKRVAVTRAVLVGGGIERLARSVDVHVWKGEREPDGADLRRLVTGAAALIPIGSDVIDAAVLEAGAPDLRVVALTSAGYDRVDLAAADRLGIQVTHTPGVLHRTVAEFALGAALAVRRRMVEGDRFVRRGQWRQQDMNLLLGAGLHGGQLGVVGYGEIGAELARLATALGMRVVHHSRTRADHGAVRWVPLDDLLTTSDVVSLHVPLAPETVGLVGAREIALMRPDAVLLNTARGGVVDEVALAAALDAGHLAGAALDVFRDEPVGADGSPLLRSERCLLTPHMASASTETRSAMVELAVDNVLAVLSGRPPLTPVRPPVHSS